MPYYIRYRTPNDRWVESYGRIESASKRSGISVYHIRKCIKNQSADSDGRFWRKEDEDPVKESNCSGDEMFEEGKSEKVEKSLEERVKELEEQVAYFNQFKGELEALESKRWAEAGMSTWG